MANEKVPYVHGAGEPEEGAKLLSPAGRLIVNGWLAGVRAVKNGTMDAFIIERSDHSSTMITPDNAGDMESRIIEHFGPSYPEIVPQPEDSDV